MNKVLMYDNILKLLRRGKWELQGDEILAFHQSFSFLIKEIEELKKPKLQVTPVVEPIKEEEVIKKKRKKTDGSV